MGSVSVQVGNMAVERDSQTESSRFCVFQSYALQPFSENAAKAIAGWIQDAKQLHQIAPSTEIPLTAEKVARWKKSRGRAYLYCSIERMIPVGYGEVTPLKRRRDHVWLGHVIIRPEDRGRGIGVRFVHALLREASEVLAATRAILVVFPDNSSAIRCYRQVGFAVVGEERHRFRAGFPPERLLRLEIDLPV